MRGPGPRPIKYRLLFECPDGTVLDVNIESAKTRKRVVNTLLNWHPTGEVFSFSSMNCWYIDTMEITGSFIAPVDLPNRIKMYLFMGI